MVKEELSGMVYCAQGEYKDSSEQRRKYLGSSKAGQDMDWQSGWECLGLI